MNLIITSCINITARGNRDKGKLELNLELEIELEWKVLELEYSNSLEIMTWAELENGIQKHENRTKLQLQLHLRQINCNEMFPPFFTTEYLYITFRVREYLRIYALFF